MLIFLKQPKDDLGYCRRYPPTIVSLGDDEVVDENTVWLSGFLISV